MSGMSGAMELTDISIQAPYSDGQTKRTRYVKSQICTKRLPGTY